MKSARLLLLLPLLAAAAGCASLPPPPIADVATSGPPDSAGPNAAIQVAASARAAAAESEEPYRLDSGDRLRVVVFGQDGLSNTYIAADQEGRGARPHHRGTCARRSRAAAPRLHPRALGGNRRRCLSTVLHPRRGAISRSVRLCATYDDRECGCNCRRVHAASLPLERHARPAGGRRRRAQYRTAAVGRGDAAYRRAHGARSRKRLRTWVGPMVATCGWTFDGLAFKRKKI